MIDILLFSSTNIFANILYSMILNWFFIFFLINNYKRYLTVDFPEKRSSHIIPTYTSGGLTFSLLISLVGLFNGFYLPILLIPLTSINLIDDRKSISIKSRFILQILTIILLLFYTSINNSLNFNIYINIFIFIFFVFFGTALINFSNFIDGIDGLLTFSMIIFFLAELLNGEIIYSYFIGFLIGFLVWNFPKAKIFMGDSGSVFLGGIYSYQIFSSGSILNSIQLLLIGSPIWLDAIFTILKRIINKEPILKSHKKHLYQRLNSNGWPHHKVVILFCTNMLILLVLSQFISLVILALISLLIFVIMQYIDIKYALPFKKAI